MGWSLPNVLPRPDAPSWSPWVCLSIIFSGLSMALVWVILFSPEGNLPTLKSGYWLPLSVYILLGIIVLITFYTVCWEILSYRVYKWNSWRRNMRLAWQSQAHQHLYVARHTVLTADLHFFPNLASGVTTDRGEASPLTLATVEPINPGILRFEELCRQLLRECRVSLLEQYPSGQLTVLIQTTAADKAAEEASFIQLWLQEALPWSAAIHVLPNELPSNSWNNYLAVVRTPLLVLAMHYRQPDENVPEFACALLLFPETMLKPSEQRDAVRVFRAMPLKTEALPRELAELRDMAQQPPHIKHLVWFSGLPASASQAVGRVVRNLPLPLHDDIATGGVIDFTKVCADYGHCAGWLMVAAATEMVNYGPGSHWLLQSDGKQASAMVLGNSLPVIHDEDRGRLSLPYPAGSLCFALFINTVAYGVMSHLFPQWLFSWSGVISVLLSLMVTLPGAVFILRLAITYLLRPRFIQAVRLAKKE